MADHTKIEWTEATWNPITGCSVTSPGCTNCYAMQLAGTRLAQHPSRAGLTRSVNGHTVWTGEVRLNEQWLDQPLRWKRPRRIFVCAHGDLFHESVPDEWIDRVFAIMALCPQHTFQVLTKRSARMRAYMDRACGRIGDAVMRLRKESLPIKLGLGPNGLGPLPHIKPGREWWPLPNVWLGVSVEDQARADQRIPDLLATPAAVRWLSCEPLLGPVDLRWIAEPDEEKDGAIDALLGCNWIDHPRGEQFKPARPGHQDRIMHRWVCSPEADILANRKLDWVVVGGESGPHARPMHPDWARSLRDQCQAAGVPFFFKQWGEWGPKTDPTNTRDLNKWVQDDAKGESLMQRLGKARAGRLIDGREWSEYPA